VSVSVCVPTRNEAATIGAIVTVPADLRRRGAIDQPSGRSGLNRWHKFHGAHHRRDAMSNPTVTSSTRPPRC
jgi:hypothetical protein